MFRALLEVQWKWTKVWLLGGLLIGFALPLLSYRAADLQEPVRVIDDMQRWGVGYAMLAAAVGLTIAWSAWVPDHRGRHVYALSLPISRVTYTAMRFGGGLMFLLIPVVGVLVGGLTIALLAPLPAGLHAYPVALTGRFLLAAGVAYAVFFAVASATPRAARVIVVAIVAFVLLEFAISAASSHSMLPYVTSVLFEHPGVLSVFTGRWALIDA